MVNYLELSQALGILWASSKIRIEFSIRGAISSFATVFYSSKYV